MGLYPATFPRRSNVDACGEKCSVDVTLPKPGSGQSPRMTLAKSPCVSAAEHGGLAAGEMQDLGGSAIRIPIPISPTQLSDSIGVNSEVSEG